MFCRHTIQVDRTPYKVKYAEDVVFYNENQSELQVFPLDDDVGVFEMHFTNSKCKMLFKY